MSSIPVKRSRRIRNTKKQSAIHDGRVTEGKRKNCVESDSENTSNYNKNKIKRYSLPVTGNKEMLLLSDEIMEAQCSFSLDDIYNTKSFIGSSQNLGDCEQEKRRSLRQLALQNSQKLDLATTDMSPLVIKCAQTPTQLRDMTSFTFSNYFTPVSLEISPLPPLPWADCDEVWEIMLQRDRDYKRDPLYLRKHPKLRPQMRSTLLDWLIEVSEAYRLHRETFYLAVDYVDRYLSVQKDIAKTRLQLVGITALFIAAKIEEIYPPKLAQFASVTDGACTEEEMLEQEVLLLQSLDWKLSPVTPVAWFTVYLQIANRSMTGASKENVDEYFDVPQFSAIHLCRVAELVDLCCLDTGFLQFSYSIIAASALYHVWGNNVDGITGHKFEELYPCIQWMHPFAKVIQTQLIKRIKKFDKIPVEDAHNIQVHNNGLQLFEFVLSQMKLKVPLGNLNNTPMVQCKGILTPPASAEKEYLCSL